MPGTAVGFISLYPTLEKPSPSMYSCVEMGWHSRVLQCPVTRSVPARQVLESFQASRRPSSYAASSYQPGLGPPVCWLVAHASPWSMLPHAFQ